MSNWMLPGPGSNLCSSVAEAPNPSLTGSDITLDGPTPPGECIGDLVPTEPEPATSGLATNRALLTTKAFKRHGPLPRAAILSGMNARENTTKNGNGKRNGSRMAPVSDPAALKSFGGPDGVRTRNLRIISLTQQGFQTVRRSPN